MYAGGPIGAFKASHLKNDFKSLKNMINKYESRFKEIKYDLECRLCDKKFSTNKEFINHVRWDEAHAKHVSIVKNNE